MTKYKPITQHELIQAITLQLPEINPLFVEKELLKAHRGHFDYTDIAKYVNLFERMLYDNRKEDM